MTRPPRELGKAAVVVSMADAQRDIERQKRRRADPPPAEKRGGALPGRWSADTLGLPCEDPCPVIPVGIEGELYHVIDSTGQFRSLPASDWSQSGIQSLFAATPNYPMWAWPRYGRAKENEPPPIKSFEADHVRTTLFRACARKGLFSPADKLRGRGAWTLRGGQLIYHAGEELWVCESKRADGADKFVCLGTGLHEGHLYPRMPALPAPWTEPIGPTDNPAGVLLQTFRRWNFERPEVDPVLLLGWIGVAYLGAALRWRPALLLLGDKGTGKSTLQEGLRDLFGDALFHTADTTAAGIYQAMAHDSRPIAVDELETEADSRKVDAVVRLMRAAASGAMARRGGSDHQAVEFTLHSAFLFSAINNPVQSAQDLSRIAILRLRNLVPDQERPPPIDADTCGRMILARLMSRWPLFAGRLEAYKGALAGGGHVARGQDTYGTLLACADLLLGEELADQFGVRLTADADWWAEHLAAATLPEVADSLPNWRDCLEHLLTSRVEAWRNGARATVGALLDEVRLGNLQPHEARQQLALTGLGYAGPGEVLPVDVGAVLAIPNRSQLVGALFAATKWAGSPGVGGPWKDALRQGPAEIVLTDKRVNRMRINGVQERCTLVALDAFLRVGES